MTKIRLVDGINSTTGRLEIFYNGLWGTVCDNKFNNIAAQVVCKQMN